MGRRIRKHATYANVMATIAVFGVLAGSGAYAAQKLKKNSVKTKSIKNSAVTGPKLANGAVTTPKIADKAITTPKLGDKQVKHGKLGELAVENDKIANGAVSKAKTDFLASSGRKTVNPTGDGNTTVPLFSIAGVNVVGVCTENGPNHDAVIRLEGDSNAFYSGVSSIDGAPVAQVTSSLPDEVGAGASQLAQRSFITLTVITPSTAIHIDGAAAVDQQGAECLFAASASAG
jgi:hypothetical protein